MNTKKKDVFLIEQNSEKRGLSMNQFTLEIIKVIIQKIRRKNNFKIYFIQCNNLCN